MKELLEDGTWRDVNDDPANAPGVLKAQRELELEASQARVRARLQAVDGQVEVEAANVAHVRVRLEEIDEFTARMMAEAAKEDR